MASGSLLLSISLPCGFLHLLSILALRIAFLLSSPRGLEGCLYHLSGLSGGGFLGFFFLFLIVYLYARNWTRLFFLPSVLPYHPSVSASTTYTRVLSWATSNFIRFTVLCIIWEALHMLLFLCFNILLKSHF